MADDSVRATNEYGLVVRRKALHERGVEYLDLLNALDEKTPLDQNEDLITFGPSFGKEAMDELLSRLERLGLKFVDDFYGISFDLPQWCGLRLTFRASGNV